MMAHYVREMTMKKLCMANMDRMSICSSCYHFIMTIIISIVILLLLLLCCYGEYGSFEHYSYDYGEYRSFEYLLFLLLFYHDHHH